MLALSPISLIGWGDILMFRTPPPILVAKVDFPD